MTTDFRALCAELVEKLDEVDRLLHGAQYVEHSLTYRARAALAEPEPEGPTDEDLFSLDQLRDKWNAQADAFNTWDELGIDEIVWWAQHQALARWGNHLTLQPVPVSERLPGPGDCDTEGRCWTWAIGTWRLSRINRSFHTHWLSAHALPLPS
jgi:hypothetical protein